MLKILNIEKKEWAGDIPDFEGGIVIAADDYYIQRMEDGRDELHFTIQTADPAYVEIQEETRIIETTENQTYAVKTIDAGSESADIGCQLDLDIWRATMYLDYKSGLKTAHAIINAARPGLEWSVQGAETDTKKRSIEMDGPTALDIVLDVEDLFGYRVRFDNYRRIATIIIPGNAGQTNAYIVDSVNLLKANFKGKSTDLYTRLYPIGKDGLRIGSVNRNKDYVENRTYTNEIISKIWVDERYTDAQSLKEDAQAKVDEACKPARSWELDVTDLHKLDAQTWQDLKMSMFDKILLVDPRRKQRYIVQIRQQRIYPHYPERNKIYVSTVAGSAQRTIKAVARQLADANSIFFQRLKAAFKEG